MKTQNLFYRFFTLGLMITAFAFIGCKSDVDSEDDTGGGSTGGSTGGGGGSAGSVQFDGTTEYLTLSADWYTGDSTICLWMRPSVVDSSGTSGHTLFSMTSPAGKYFFLSFDDNEIDFHFEDANDTDIQIEGVSAFAANNWYQVCVTVDHSSGANTSRIYVNGAVVPGTDTDATVGVATDFTTLSIGYEPEPTFQAGSGNKIRSFEGLMDNVMIWQTALPASAIAQLYSGGSGFDPQFVFGSYTAPHRSALYHWFLMGDDPVDQISGGSAVINDTEGNENLLPVNFESSDFEIGAW